jgi:hypothetical protein
MSTLELVTYGEDLLSRRDDRNCIYSLCLGQNKTSQLVYGAGSMEIHRNKITSFNIRKIILVSVYGIYSIPQESISKSI